jgi:hypothetical protein
LSLSHNPHLFPPKKGIGYGTFHVWRLFAPGVFFSVPGRIFRKIVDHAHAAD